MRPWRRRSWLHFSADQQAVGLSRCLRRTALAAGFIDEIDLPDRALGRAQEGRPRLAELRPRCGCRQRAARPRRRARGARAGEDGVPAEVGVRAGPDARARSSAPRLRDQARQVALSTLNEDSVFRVTTRRVAEQGVISAPAAHEFSGDKRGLLRAVVLPGFPTPCRWLLEVPETLGAVADVERLIPVFRWFRLDDPALALVMFSRPFQDFDPAPRNSWRRCRCETLRRQNQAATDAGPLTGDRVLIAHVSLALAQGLAVEEVAAGWASRGCRRFCAGGGRGHHDSRGLRVLKSAGRGHPPSTNHAAETMKRNARLIRLSAIFAAST